MPSTSRFGRRVTLAGQLSGVEGCVESIVSGLAAGLFVAAELLGKVIEPPPPTTATGGLLRYLTVSRDGFQPSNVVWAMIDTPPKERGKGKRERREAAAKKALEDLAVWKNTFAV